MRVISGIIESSDEYMSPMRALFRHLQDSMNDKNDLRTLESLADVHGFKIAIDE